MSESTTIANAVALATSALADVSDSPRLDGELLLARELTVPRSHLIAHCDAVVDPETVARFDAAVARRAQGEPLAYILGEKEFWSLSLKISPGTLVPRPETELLVEQALTRLPTGECRRVLDLGTGSGAIALAIATERPDCEVTGIDISDASLSIARDNAGHLGLENVRFLSGDWTGPVRSEQFDIIVSNPPYVADGDPALAALSHEPREALVGGDDGLDHIRCLAVQTRRVIRPVGTLLLEHGAAQADAVASILQRAGWCDVNNLVDLAGLPRVTLASATTPKR